MFLLQAELVSLDLTTWGGIIIAATTIMSLLKSMIPTLKDGGSLPRVACLVLTIGLAIASKASGLGLEAMSWLEVIIGGFLATAASGATYEHLTKALQKGGGA